MSREPSSEQIQRWKDEYQNIFSIDDGNQLYVFRPLIFKEYDKAISIEEKEGGVAAEDFLVLSCLLFPELTEEDLKRSKAGVFQTLADYILDLSGFGDARQAADIMKEKREKMETIKYSMFNFILSVLDYTPEELETEDFRAVAEKVAIAEQVIKIRQQINDPSVSISFDIRAEEEEQEEGAPSNADPIAERLQQALGG